MNTQLSWLIPIIGSIYLLSIRIVWMLLDRKHLQHFGNSFLKIVTEFLS